MTEKQLVKKYEGTTVPVPIYDFAKMLHLYYDAEATNIWEYSGNISKEIEELKRNVTKMIADYGLPDDLVDYFLSNDLRS